VTYVLDTNTLIDFFRGRGRVAERLLATPPASVAVPSIVAYELEVGVLKSIEPERRRSQLESFLEVVEVLPFGRAETRAAAEVRAGLEAGGRGIGPMNTLIAGVALAVGGILVTRNTAEFGRVPGLRVESWY